MYIGPMCMFTLRQSLVAIVIKCNASAQNI